MRTNDAELRANMPKESLYATPSFLSGVARIFDFWGLLDRYNTSPSEHEADARALGADWRAVGDDLRAAIREYEDAYPAQAQLNLFASTGE